MIWLWFTIGACLIIAATSYFSYKAGYKKGKEQKLQELQEKAMKKQREEGYTV